jgi:hypothetical protein
VPSIILLLINPKHETLPGTLPSCIAFEGRFACVAQAGGNTRDDLLPLLYKDEELVDLQVVFGSPLCCSSSTACADV